MYNIQTESDKLSGSEFIFYKGSFKNVSQI